MRSACARRRLRLLSAAAVVVAAASAPASASEAMPATAPLPPVRPPPEGQAMPLEEWQAFDQSFSFNAEMWTDSPQEPIWAEMSAIAAQLLRRGNRRAIAPILTLAPVARGIKETDAGLSGPLAVRQEKAFGLRLRTGQGVSFATEFKSGEGTWQPVDTRLAWRVARQMPADEGWVWSAGFGGGLPVGHAPYSQTLDVALGRRFRGGEGAWSVMPELAVNTVYTSHGAERWQTTLRPQVKAKVDVLKSADDRLKLYLESSVGYALPVGADAAGLSAGTRLNLIFRPGG